MLGAVGKKLRLFFKKIEDVVRNRHARKLAKLAELEKRERKAIVEALVKKLEAAHSECEQEGKTSVVLVVSVKEIVFMERNLRAWVRYFKESEIYAAGPER